MLGIFYRFQSSVMTWLIQMINCLCPSNDIYSGKLFDEDDNITAEVLGGYTRYQIFLTE